MNNGLMDGDITAFVEKSQQYGFNSTEHSHIQWLESVYSVWRAVGTEAGVPIEDVLYTVVEVCKDVDTLVQCLGVDLSWCRRQDRSFHSQLISPITTPTTAGDSHISEGILENKRCILVGCMKKASPDHPGQLVISDVTHSLPVEIRHTDCDEVLGCLDQWVVLPSWNLITTKKGKCYLELCAKPVLMSWVSLQPVLPKQLPVLTSKGASALLLHKDTVKPGRVDIVTTIEAVGEIHRVKTDALFCIRLHHGVNIIVKTPEFLHWQKFLIPGDKKIFTSMRATTLKKGAGSSIKVYVPWKNSQLLSATSQEYTCVSTQEWLQVNGGDTDELDRIISEETEFEEEEGHDLDMASYQGVITSDDFAPFGIYVLDAKVGLCVSCVPAIHKYQFLRVGSKVIIYNAHFSRSNQFPHMRVLCCTTSCIKVLEFSVLDNKPKMVSLPVVLQQSLKKYCVTQVFMDTFINFIYCLHKKFSGSLHNELTSIVETTFGHCCVTNQDRVGRVYIQEFLSQSHKCGLLQEEDDSKVCPVVPDMNKFTQEIQCLETGADNLSTDSDTYWNYHHQLQGQSHKVLVGILDLSLKNGRIMLRDDTGSVNCVITMTTSDEPHVCSQICSCCDLEPGSNFRCPLLHPCCVGAVVAVTKFTVIREQFSSLNSSLNNLKMTDSDRTPGYMCYVMFSMINVVLICRPTVLKTPEEQVPHKKGKIDHDQAQLPSDTDKGRQLVLINHKETLVLEQRIHGDSYLRMAVAGHILKYPDTDLLDWDLIRTLKQSCHQHNLQKSHTDCDKQILSPPLIFLFEKDAVRWCHTILPGGIYEVVCPTEKLCNPGASSWQLKKAIVKAGGRSVHKMPSNVKLRRVFPNKTPAAGQSHAGNLSIKAILTESCDGTLVSFEGLIIRRCPAESDSHQTSMKRPLSPDYHLNTQLGVGTPDGCGVKIVVRCQQSGNEIDVYFNLDSFVYPLGLIPGVGVWLERLERKVSRRNNIYCQFIAISCLHIQYLTDMASETPSPDHCLEIGPPHIVYLADLWRNKIQGSPFPVCCHVQRFLKLSLKWLCHHCGAVCVSEACSNHSCRGEFSSRFLARASIIIEDGTGAAIVTLRDADVQKLLMLSDREWSSLQCVVQTQGEIFTQKTCPEFGSPVEMLLYHLCESSLVKKDWEMMLRSRTGTSTEWSSGGSLDHMTLQEFSLKTVDTGLASMETRCLPFLQLDCVGVKSIDYRKWTLLCLQ